MPTGNAYSSGHLVLSHLGFAEVLCWDHTLLYQSMPLSQTWLFTEFDIPEYVFIGHLQRVWHANRGRLPFRTHGAVPPFLRLACVPIVETRFREFAMSLLDFSPLILLGTFCILLVDVSCVPSFLLGTRQDSTDPLAVLILLIWGIHWPTSVFEYNRQAVPLKGECLLAPIIFLRAEYISPCCSLPLLVYACVRWMLEGV